MSKVQVSSAYLADIRFSDRIELLFVVPHKSGQPYYKILTDPACVQAICYKLRVSYKNNEFTAHIMFQRLEAAIENKKPLAYRLVQDAAHKRPYLKFIGHSIPDRPFNPEHRAWEFYKEAVAPSPAEVKEYLRNKNVDCDGIFKDFKIFRGFMDLPLGYIPLAQVEELEEVAEELEVVAGIPLTNIWVPALNIEPYLEPGRMDHYFALAVTFRESYNRVMVPDSTNFSSSYFR